MKKMALWLTLGIMLLCTPLALGELGFAEVNRDRVNLREAPGGARICYLDEGHSVFVLEEKTVGGQHWCRVNTLVNKRCREAWVMGSMLRFISEEFHDVVSVQAGENYVTGLRADGTVAIMGDDMPHHPCIETVREWTNIAQVTSFTCSVTALSRDHRIVAVGKDRQFGTDTAARLCGDDPILLNEAGYIMPETWQYDEDSRYMGYDYLSGAAAQAQCTEALGYTRWLSSVLTKDGNVICTGEFEHLQHCFADGPYTDIDADFHHILALRADGGVDAAGQHYVQDKETCDVSGWKNVVKVAAGREHSLGLKADGTVYYAGDDADHAWTVVNWTDVVDIDAGEGYSIALKKDGTVMMAGRYEGYFQ